MPQNAEEAKATLKKLVDKGLVTKASYNAGDNSLTVTYNINEADVGNALVKAFLALTDKTLRTKTRTPLHDNEIPEGHAQMVMGGSEQPSKECAGILRQAGLKVENVSAVRQHG